MHSSHDACLRVAVLAGGDSAEREVSLASGEAVAAALDAAGHHPAQLDPSTLKLEAVPWYEFDVCFIALHGGAGEDGRVQARLERLGVAYTGSGPAACARAMSKSAAKDVLRRAGVHTPPCALFAADEAPAALACPLAALGYPLAVKPDGQGSSLGVGRAEDFAAAARLVAAAGKLDAFVIAEPWIEGREFTVAVLGRQPLPVLEIVTPAAFFDYTAKYCADNTEYRFELDAPGGLAADLQHLAVATAEALGTDGLVRVDLLVGGDGTPWVLELNTVPGMTDHSLAPKAAARAGLPMPALCDRLAQSALRKRSGTQQEAA